jgi:hypothetical protein
MLKTMAVALVVAGFLAPMQASADSWTQGQAQWAAHGYRHGKWDCNGKCPSGRRTTAAKRSKH